MAHNDHDTQSAGIQFVLGNRQVAAVLFMILIIMGLMSTIAYLAGRMSGPARADSTPRPQRRAEQVIFVDAASGDKLACPDGTAPIQKSRQDDKGVAARPTPAPVTPAPQRQLYLQVAATDRTDADSAAAKLTQHGVPARVAPGPTDTTFRVLAGPLADAAHAERVRVTAERAGFARHFLRLY